jgi:Animal haem peroxidase
VIRTRRAVQVTVLTVVLIVGGRPTAPAAAHVREHALTQRTLDGSGNNVDHPRWGEAGTQYPRVAKADYADGIGQMRDGPAARYVSNRIFNDVGQNLFSENRVTQWAWAWGQWLDHDFGREQDHPRQSAPLTFNPRDPLENFGSLLLSIDFWRNAPAPGTGVTTTRQQINMQSSYIDASNVYGVTPARLDWLRTGPVDGNPANNGPRLLLGASHYLPRADARGAPSAAPSMELDGALITTPTKAAVAGDERANENIALTAIHTLFAREHNRLVGRLPNSLPAETRFQIARRLVGAEEQYITYEEFLPALGIKLRPYRGYRRSVNSSLANEFAVVGYRAHSMVNGNFDATEPAGTWSEAKLTSFAHTGITVKAHDGLVTLSIPLAVAYGNPDLLEQVGLGPMLESLGAERQYRNDEQIDDSLRSVLFQTPKPDTPDPSVCGRPVDPHCFSFVLDLGATDLQRARDHGMPAYNAMRAAYGLTPKATFEDITGEPASADLGNRINDRTILDFVGLRDEHGRPVPLGTPAAEVDAVEGTRRTTLASRLYAIYGDVGVVDAFVGMMSERHIAGTEFGELQLAMWKRQFESLRDGDRFFYLNDPALREIQKRYGISYRHSLAELIRLNTHARVRDDVFRLPPGLNRT